MDSMVEQKRAATYHVAQTADGAHIELCLRAGFYGGKAYLIELSMGYGVAVRLCAAILQLPCEPAVYVLRRAIQGVAVGLRCRQACHVRP